VSQCLGAFLVSQMNRKEKTTKTLTNTSKTHSTPEID
jgi:hypothetical protein